MASGAALKLNTPYRAFHIGYPGSGKTGALVSLLEAGYKIRVLDFEGNFNPLIDYASEAALANLDVVTLQDRFRSGDKFVEVSGLPEAFTNALKLMQEWKYKDDAGNEVNLGKSSEWGADTIVVVDSMSSGGQASKLRAMKFNNKMPNTMTSAVWGQAVADWNNFLEAMKNGHNKFHLIVNSHKQILGPGDFIQQGDADAVKEKKLEMISGDMIPPRIYPVAVTKPQATTIHGMLPTMLEFVKTEKQGKTVRVINTVSGPEIDVKISGRLLKPQYGIENGLREIFTALGYKEPGL